MISVFWRWKWSCRTIVIAAAIVPMHAVAAVLMFPIEEPVVRLSSPPDASGSPLFRYRGSSLTAVAITATPLLCADTSAPSSPGIYLNLLYYSTSGSSAAVPRPFVYGASAASPTESASAGGAFVYFSKGAIRLAGDASLVCYGLDANGVHGPTPGIMRDQFEGAYYSPILKQQFNSAVVLSVFHLPTNSGDYYGYTIDVTLPPTPIGLSCSTMQADCNFALLEGYDTGVFATSTANPDEGWCLGSANNGANCVGSVFKGGINANYATWQALGVPDLKSGASQATVRFVARRYFASGVSSLPSSNEPVVIAALFSAFDFDENYIRDNVAVGYGNSPPAVVQ